MFGEENLFAQALAAARQNDLATARILVKQILRQEPQNIDAWLLGAHVVETQADAMRCYERVLKIDPNHAYARQKLNELRPAAPDAPPAPGANAANRSLPARPSPAPFIPAPDVPALSDEENLTAAPVNEKDKARREITIALVGVLLVLCLAALIVAALPTINRLRTPQVTPTYDEIFNVVYNNSRAANEENLEAYMDTIHPGMLEAFATRAALELIFSQYDLNYYFYDLRMISASADEAKIHFALETTKINGPEFSDNIITGTMTLRRDNGVWKIYNQDVESTQYK